MFRDRRNICCVLRSVFPRCQPKRKSRTELRFAWRLKSHTLPCLAYRWRMKPHSPSLVLRPSSWSSEYHYCLIFFYIICHYYPQNFCMNIFTFLSIQTPSLFNRGHLHLMLRMAQVRYLKIIEKSGYQAFPWVRYITQNGDYQLRMS